MGEKYHHGNLRQALIDAGIKIINEEGEGSLSLRKVAAACDVSHAAPYAHFPDKESLIQAIKDSVMERFSNELEAAAASAAHISADAAIFAMGKRYVMFFREHPDYFYFLFQKQTIEVHTGMAKINENDYAPYQTLRRLFDQFLEENSIQMTQEEKEIDLLKTWALVQGLSSIACMDRVETDMPWEEIAEKCLKG